MLKALLKDAVSLQGVYGLHVQPAWPSEEP